MKTIQKKMRAELGTAVESRARVAQGNGSKMCSIVAKTQVTCKTVDLNIFFTDFIFVLKSSGMVLDECFVSSYGGMSVVK
jgi:hypothetical protein